MIVAGLVCLWLVGVFAHQVGEAAAAADQVDAMRARNAAVVGEIDSLQAELKVIQQTGFIDFTARGYLLGSPREIPFTIDPAAPPLPADAPGSTGIKPQAVLPAAEPARVLDAGALRLALAGPQQRRGGPAAHRPRRAAAASRR